MKRLIIYGFVGVTVIVAGIFVISLLNNQSKAIKVAYVGRFSETIETSDIDAYRTVEYALKLMNGESRSYELIRFDLSDYETPKALTSAIHLNGTDVVVGPATSTETVPLLEAYRDLNIPVFPIATSSDLLTGVDDNIFRLTNSISSQVAYYSAIINENKHQSILIFYDENNLTFSKGYADRMVNQLLEYNIESRICNVGALDDESVRDKILEASVESQQGYDGIVLAIGPGKAGLLTQFLASYDEEAVFYHIGWSNSDWTLDYLKDVPNTVYSMALAEPSYKDQYEQFIEVLEDEINLHYSSYSYFGYEVPFFIDSIYRHVGSVELSKVKEYVHSLDVYEGQFALYSFDHTGDGERDYSLLKVKDGQYKEVVQ